MVFSKECCNFALVKLNVKPKTFLIMKKFEDLSANQLWKLRNEVCVNSLFVCDYENSYGFNAKAVSDFFDGYYDFMWELATEEHGENITHDFVMGTYDNKETLWQWFNCYDDLSWIN